MANQSGSPNIPPKSVVTILAEPPVAWGTRPPVHWDGNRTIALAEELVLPHAKLQGRASVADSYFTPDDKPHGVSDHFAEVEKQGPCIIQIIGHGRPGTLALGNYWNAKYQENSNSLYYSLDGNPRAYWALAAWTLPEDCEIWLVGCAVGQVSWYDTSSDGDALMYDLSNLLKRKVKAAAMEVSPQVDFDQDGKFTGCLLEAGQSENNRKVVNKLLSSTPDDCSPCPNPPEVTLVTATPMRSGLRIPVTGFGLDFRYERIGPPPALSLPDLEVEVVLDGAHLPGQIYCNGRYLRVKCLDGSIRRFARPKGVFDDRALREHLLRQQVARGAQHRHHP